MEQLGVSREEVEVTVLKEGKSGILGMGAEDAVVRVQKRVPTASVSENSETAEISQAVLEELLALMGVDATVLPEAQPVVEENEAGTCLAFDIQGDDLGILIGRRSQTLSRLQYIVRLVVGHKTNVWMPIVIDAGGYKKRRYQALENLAQYAAEQVRTRGTSFTLEPMPAYERRIVHLALANNPDVRTQSIGEGESRRVVILLREDLAGKS
ncbi:MAG: protein jag [Chloroflexi bacterium]|nr:protein jag [Chloroflexota bacterium]